MWVESWGLPTFSILDSTSGSSFAENSLFPAFPRNFPSFTMISPRESTTSAAPWTTRPSYGV